MFEKIHTVHFVGIGGIGISAVAKYFAIQGKNISGSDVASSLMTEELRKKGIRFYVGHEASQVSENVDLLVYSSAIPVHNCERQRAKELGVQELSYVDVLGELSKSFSTIVVSGTHGKSTTTAMLGLILEQAGYDPTVILGSRVPSFPEGNLRVGSGRFFVVEGCEYKANMLKLHPEMIVLTNIEEEHLDFYRDLAHIQETFQTFVDGLKGKGKVVWNADDPVSQHLTITRGTRYGIEAEADYFISKREVYPGKQVLSFSRKGDQKEFLGILNLSLPGEYNAMNALAAMTAAMELGVPFEICAKTLESFKGIWRRFERLGVWKGAELISDYGHHPTEISATLQAIREFFPDRRLVLCYQPHQHARTISLQKEIVEAVSAADVIILPEIYEVAGRTEEKTISSRNLVEKIKSRHPEKDVFYASDLSEAEHHLQALVQEQDVLLLQGAGTIDDLARKLAH
ncbi:MAG: UDP-N-acetylmuramate-L-alanine ligase [Candidatus Uhrbacteria bacterium GW2011_GWE2_40_58]|nr:MAG: UDP-N-acetylmuramate-L-alanine ligase [Candidatus Uhrbacteria bacterium GW2011_GWF2_40_263]KKR67547.1 MAG: UDP-N-acetylmuramate-L-alanine ligase [Candidatus Uhrbacteria bacterium GW2011_GWE2_40_58]OGL93654.1 MAG: UDP-N-acetylmuramate--L-alanine ligase [Candidatus Uhrbacteria bacterium RIFOXYA2_FULL_40_9]OGL96492.1 MAG: UDP-N-acetylmuramate--L-alanine ligase [Candidatus Uhrbacteria bacterium RIFOXYB2_FULL_41_18]HBK34591.1 UDP-N-acetylmuramate--L-alanine ligase [Candidatus Uhrbacteria bac